MNKQIYILAGVGVLIIAGGAFLLFQNPKSSENQAPVSEQQSSEQPSLSLEVIPVITYSDTGYSPQTLSVKAGDTVSFVNQSSLLMWSASAMHPTHTVYPGSGIEKCGTSEQSKIFDACKGIPSGQEWDFQFNEKGTWKYHDHLNPSNFGTIVVE